MIQEDLQERCNGTLLLFHVFQKSRTFNTLIKFQIVSVEIYYKQFEKRFENITQRKWPNFNLYQTNTGNLNQKSTQEKLENN